MDKVLAVGARSIQASQIGLEVTARNISQGSAPGYKRQVFTFESDALGPATRLSVDHGPGALVPSPGVLDLAVEGGGFLMVQAGGQTLLSRGGQFERGPEGLLVNAAGHVLLDEGGSPISVGSSDIDIQAHGTVLHRGLPVSRLAFVQPEEGVKLAALGGTLFAAQATRPADLTTSQVRQRMLEKTNVETAAEMTNMMLALRMAEVGARLVQTYDGISGQAITTLGRGMR